MRVLEHGENSNNNCHGKFPFVGNVDGKNTANLSRNVLRSYTKSAHKRSYTKAANKRLCWTDDLHHRFLLAINKLGGVDGATPKIIHRVMECDMISVSHVKSHLQMYRQKQYNYLTKGALEKAEKLGMKVELKAKIKEIEVSVPRPGPRRQTRLERVRSMLAKYYKYTLEEYPLTQPDPLNLGDNKNVTTVKMPGVPSSSSIDSTVEEIKEKRKQEMVFKCNSSVVIEPTNDPNDICLELKL